MYSAELVVSTGRVYRFRYLIDGVHWQIHWGAKRHAPNEIGDTTRSSTSRRGRVECRQAAVGLGVEVNEHGDVFDVIKAPPAAPKEFGHHATCAEHDARTADGYLGDMPLATGDINEVSDAIPTRRGRVSMATGPGPTSSRDVGAGPRHAWDGRRLSCAAVARRPAGDRPRRLPRRLALHQILQWHHMLTATGRYRSTTVAGLEANTLADGLFHVAAWIFVFLGSWLAVAAWQDGRLAPPWRTHVGPHAGGLGGFNLVEGVIDHHLLRIHHVRDDVADTLPWDLGFLAIGLALLAAGLVLVATSRRGWNPRYRRRERRNDFHDG